jgi:hypothetical protein
MVVSSGETKGKRNVILLYEKKTDCDQNYRNQITIH